MSSPSTASRSRSAEPTRLFRYHKPRGLIVTARDPQGRPTVFDNLPAGLPRVISIGRLDLNSEGLLLLTNDGELKRRLELPATGWMRRYRVRVHGARRSGGACRAGRGHHHRGHPLRPGARGAGPPAGRQRLDHHEPDRGQEPRDPPHLRASGLAGIRLIRVAYGPFQIGSLAPGAVEEVPAKVLREQLGANS